MVKGESGSEAVQFIFAIIGLMTLLFGSLYIACYTTSASILSSELSQACLSLDTAGLAKSPDKARFVAREIADESSQLDFDSIQVSDVRIDVSNRLSPGESGGVDQRMKVSSVSFSVCYRLPLVLSVVGMKTGQLERRVFCAIENERISEVTVS